MADGKQDEVEAEPGVIVYQIMNFTREEMFFGITSQHIEKEVLQIAKDKKGPASGWAKGDVVSWRPLTTMLKVPEARLLHRQFEEKTPPNKFKVIPTYVP